MMRATLPAEIGGEPAGRDASIILSLSDRSGLGPASRPVRDVSFGRLLDLQLAAIEWTLGAPAMQRQGRTCNGPGACGLANRRIASGGGWRRLRGGRGGDSGEARNPAREALKAIAGHH